MATPVAINPLSRIPAMELAQEAVDQTLRTDPELADNELKWIGAVFGWLGEKLGSVGLTSTEKSLILFEIYSRMKRIALERMGAVVADERRPISTGTEADGSELEV